MNLEGRIHGVLGLSYWKFLREVDKVVREVGGSK
jgi:hypothetical protein